MGEKEDTRVVRHVEKSLKKTRPLKDEFEFDYKKSIPNAELFNTLATSVIKFHEQQSNIFFDSRNKSDYNDCWISCVYLQNQNDLPGLSFGLVVLLSNAIENWKEFRSLMMFFLIIPKLKSQNLLDVPNG